MKEILGETLEEIFSEIFEGYFGGVAIHERLSQRMPREISERIIGENFKIIP